MDRQRLYSLGALSLVAGVVVAACTPATQPGATPTSAALPVATAVSGVPKVGGTLTAWLGSKPTVFSPLVAAAIGNVQVEQLIFGRLVEMNEKFELVPELAERWDISPDATRFTFYLRKGVKWSDGAPFTCKDVLFSFKARMDPRTGSPVGLPEVKGAADFKDAKIPAPPGLQCVDDMTFRIELDQGNAALISGNLASNVTPWFILPERILGTVEPSALKGHPFFLKPTVGTGPFTFVRYETDQFVELARNASYWGAPRPYLDRVILKLVAPDLVAAPLEKGEMQMAQVSADTAQQLSKARGLVVTSTPGTGPLIVHMAQDRAQWQDKRIRQAMLYAIDRAQIVKQVAKDYGSVVNTFVLGPAWAVEPNLEKYPYDPEKAKRLLKEAGWDSNRVVKFQWIPGVDPYRDQVAPLLQGYLAAVGVKVELNPVQLGPLLENLEKRTFDLSIQAGSNYFADPEVVSDKAMCAGAFPKGNNIAHYCNKRVDELLTAGRATPDQARRATIYKEVSRILNDEVPWLWIMLTDTIYATSDRLVGFKVVGDFLFEFWNAEEWWLN